MNDMNNWGHCADRTPTMLKSPCGCGDQGCPDCSAGPLVRPRFFAGQLLTEEDLQLLTDYVAAKSRLHNRYLHGDGVVCGLLVVCHPCGGGKVIVQPGYALDCCGNDIPVPCPVELDINALARELRITRQGGYDCGDPCVPPRKADPKHPERWQRQRYCLYLKYCEDESDPVTPYTHDEPCGTQPCQASRVHEGYCFELRCPAEDPEPPDLWDRLRCCIGDLTAADKAADDAFALNDYCQRIMQAERLINAGVSPEFTNDDRSAMKQGVAELQSFLDEYREAGEKKAPELNEEKVRMLLDSMQTAASAVARYELLDESARADLEEQMPKLGHELEQARKIVQQSAPPLRGLAQEKLVSLRDQTIAETWVDQALTYTADLDVAERRKREGWFFAFNAPNSIVMQARFSQDLGRLRNWLLDRLDKTTLVGDCSLRKEVQAVDIPQNQHLDPYGTGRAAQRLKLALLRYLLDCICAALNPPCLPCPDRGVKLACLEVEDCEVVSICNLERSFVLTGPSLYYWLPLLRSLGEAFEKLCCELVERLRRPCREEKEPPSIDYGPTYFANTASTYRFVEGQPQLSAVLRMAGISEATARSAVNLSGNLGAIVRDEPALGLDRLAARDLLVPVRELRGAVVEGLVAQPEVRASFERLAAERVAKVEARVEEAAAATTEAVAEVNGRLGRVERDLSGRLTAAGLVNTKVVKDLKSALETQQQRAEQLEARLEKLERGGEQ